MMQLIREMQYLIKLRPFTISNDYNIFLAINSLNFIFKILIKGSALKMQQKY